MVPPSQNIDDPENLRRFREYIETSKKGTRDLSLASSEVQPAVSVSAPLEKGTKQQMHTGQATDNEGVGHNSATRSIASFEYAPELNPYTAGIPKEFWKVPSPIDTPSSGSPPGQPRPSPHLSGLIAPTNTPQVKASVSRPHLSDVRNTDVTEKVSLYKSKLETTKAVDHPAAANGRDASGDTVQSEVTSVKDSYVDPFLSKSRSQNISQSKVLVSVTPTNFHSSQFSVALENGQGGVGLQVGLPSSNKGDIQVTDFATPSKKASVPPHLRGIRPMGQSKVEPRESQENIMIPLVEPMMESAEAAINISPLPSETILQEELEVTDDDIGAAVQSPKSVDATTRQITLLHFNAIEATGYFSAESLALLHQVRDSIVVPSMGNEEAADTLPAKTYKDPTRPLDKHHIVPASPIKTSPVGEQTSLQDISNFAKGKPDVDIPNDSPGKPVSALSAPATDTKTTITELPPKTRSPMDAATIETKPTSTELVPKTKASAATSITEEENREHQVYFESWGKGLQRDTPAAKIRKVIITDLPYNASYSTVAGLVFGGPLEEIVLRTSASGIQTASVRFIDAKDCERYYEETSNGVVYGKDTVGRELVSFVKLAQDVDVVGGMLRTWIEQGATRCVRAVGVDEDWGTDGLKKHAEQKGRTLEGIEEGTTPGGSRAVTWRFCKIEHAVTFKAFLARDEEWEHVNVHFTPDPCAPATGVHFDK